MIFSIVAIEVTESVPMFFAPSFVTVVKNARAFASSAGTEPMQLTICTRCRARCAWSVARCASESS